MLGKALYALYIVTIGTAVALAVQEVGDFRSKSAHIVAEDIVSAETIKCGGTLLEQGEWRLEGLHIATNDGKIFDVRNCRPQPETSDKEE